MRALPRSSPVVGIARNDDVSCVGVGAEERRREHSRKSSVRGIHKTRGCYMVRRSRSIILILTTTNRLHAMISRRLLQSCDDATRPASQSQISWGRLRVLRVVVEVHQGVVIVNTAITVAAAAAAAAAVIAG